MSVAFYVENQDRILSSTKISERYAKINLAEGPFLSCTCPQQDDRVGVHEACNPLAGFVCFRANGCDTLNADTPSP